MVNNNSNSLGRSPSGDGRNIYSPSELNREARMHLEAGFPVLWVSGEISNLAQPASGHKYFSLKDAKAQLRCALFRQKAMLVQANMQNGQQVLVRGRISLYEPRGDYQFIADYVETAGEGQLRQQFEALKKLLASEGLFDEQRKHPLPAMPKTIGVITSPSGAAIKDFLQVLQRRWPLAKVVIYASSVQGEKAPAELCSALRIAEQEKRVDLLVMTRGGGSLEDLWAFNDEQLARQIAACTIPLVSAVGHEIDFSISDFVADMRAPTPSAAAEMISPDQQSIERRIQQLQHRLRQNMQWHLQQHQQQVDQVLARLQRNHPRQALQRQQQQLLPIEKRLQTLHPERSIQRYQEHLNSLQKRLSQAMQRRLQAKSQHVEQLQRTLYAMGPQSVLERGYAVVLHNNDKSSQVLSRPEDFNQAQPVILQFAEFQVAATTIADSLLHQAIEHEQNTD